MSKKSLQFKTDLTIPWGKLSDTISWCSDNCHSDWNFTVIETGEYGKYQFRFENEKEFMIFLLRNK